jgi:HAMP domain-containing protein
VHGQAVQAQVIGSARHFASRRVAIVVTCGRLARCAKSADRGGAVKAGKAGPAAADLAAAWWPTAQRLDPLQALRQTVDAMDSGAPVPAAAAAIVGPALRQYLDGRGSDITKNLGLRPRKGGRHESPLALERRRRRDDLIIRVYEAQPDDTRDKARPVAARLAGQQAAREVTDAELVSAVNALMHEFGTDLPTSTRTIRRIVHDRQA